MEITEKYVSVSLPLNNKQMEILNKVQDPRIQADWVKSDQTPRQTLKLKKQNHMIYKTTWFMENQIYYATFFSGMT